MQVLQEEYSSLTDVNIDADKSAMVSKYGTTPSPTMWGSSNGIKVWHDAIPDYGGFHVHASTPSGWQFKQLPVTTVGFTTKKDSLWFLVDFKGAVLDSEIRELLEYWYFVCKPMYANYCGHSFENMIGCLTQSIPGRNNGTDNIFVINTKDILDERWKEVARTRIVCNEQPWKAEITSYPVINENIRKMCCKVQQYSG